MCCATDAGRNSGRWDRSLLVEGLSCRRGMNRIAGYLGLVGCSRWAEFGLAGEEIAVGVVEGIAEGMDWGAPKGTPRRCRHMVEGCKQEGSMVVWQYLIQQLLLLYWEEVVGGTVCKCYFLVGAVEYWIALRSDYLNSC